MSEAPRADARFIHCPGEPCLIWTADGCWTDEYCVKCRNVWPCPAFMAAQNPRRAALSPHEFFGPGRRCIMPGCWRGRAAACHQSYGGASGDNDEISVDEIRKLLDESTATRCAYIDFNTCRAQNCGNYAPFLGGPPFCGDCLALLPDVTRRRLAAEWERRPMVDIEEPRVIDKPFLRPISVRRSKQMFYAQETADRVRRQIVDREVLEAHWRRLETQTAWTLRTLRRKQRHS